MRLSIAKNTLYQILARVVSSGASFLIVILIIHQYGWAYGDFAKITAYVTLFYLIADFGFNAIFLQKIDNKLRFRDLLYPRLVFAGLIVVIINLLAVFLPYNPILQTGFSPAVRIGIAIFSLTLFTESILYTCLAVFQRELQYQLFLYAEIVGSFMTLALVVVFIMLHTPLLDLLYAFIIGGILQSITTLLLTKENIFPIHFDSKFFLQLTRETLPIGLMLFFNLVFFRIDMLLLSIFKSTQDVAIYDLAYKFFDFLIALPLFLSNALYPTLLQHQKNHRIEPATVRKFVLLFFTLAIPLVIIIWILSPFIRFVKPEYIASALPLRILVLSLPIFFVTSILQWILIAKKQQKKLVGVYIVGTVINVLLNLIFIPQYSYVASSVITGISELLVGIMLFILIYR